MEEADAGKRDQILFFSTQQNESYIFIFESNFFIIPQKENDDCMHMFHTTRKLTWKLLKIQFFFFVIKRGPRKILSVFYLCELQH